MNEDYTEGVIRDLVSREVKALKLLNEWYLFSFVLIGEIPDLTIWNDEAMDLVKRTKKHFLETGR